jgi:hypothetical protein
MTRVRRRRRYISPWLFLVSRPLFRHSGGRSAYVLRVVGNRFGPVVRVDRRRSQLPVRGPDRRRPHAA